MFPILEARSLAPEIKLFRILAPRVARKQRAGQFVVVRLHDRGERIPLTIASSDPVAGTIVLVVQGVGKTTRLMNALGTGDAILDLVGPLGKPSDGTRNRRVPAHRHLVRHAWACTTTPRLRDAE